MDINALKIYVSPFVFPAHFNCLISYFLTTEPQHSSGNFKFSWRIFLTRTKTSSSSLCTIVRTGVSLTKPISEGHL